MRIVIVGAGIFGLTAAIELRGRGHEVLVLDDGEVPNPLAESTDISKVVRLDYGADLEYVELAERALAGWRRWNAQWLAPVFHETGILYVSRAPMAPGGFERESFDALTRRGHPLERLDGATIARRHPAYRPGAYVDGYYNPQGGWVEATTTGLRLGVIAAGAGVTLLEGRGVASLDGPADRVTGVLMRDGDRISADCVVIAAGAWTPLLVPALAPFMVARGQSVFHLRPARVGDVRAAVFPVFLADVARTGFYGFPLHPTGIVKIANHGPGVIMAPESATREVGAAAEAALRAFLRDSFPSLVDAPIVARRLCVYSDTIDEHFWIAADPSRAGLVVAAGGSGHGFKFAPVLGGLIADAVEAKRNPWSEKFGWRTPGAAGMRVGEASRSH